MKQPQPIRPVRSGVEAFAPLVPPIEAAATPEPAAPTDTPKPAPLAAIEPPIKAAIDPKYLRQPLYTPPDLAKHLVELAGVKDGHAVLEPSCGDGAILRALLATDIVFSALTAVEINLEAARVARNLPGMQVGQSHVYEQDFFRLKLRVNDFDRIIMSPPFGAGEDLEHLRRALSFLSTGGVLVAIMAPNTARTPFQEILGQYDYAIEELPAHTFMATAEISIPRIIVTLRK